MNQLNYRASEDDDLNLYKIPNRVGKQYQMESYDDLDAAASGSGGQTYCSEGKM